MIMTWHGERKRHAKAARKRAKPMVMYFVKLYRKAGGTVSHIFWSQKDAENFAKSAVVPKSKLGTMTFPDYQYTHYSIKREVSPSAR
jgi:hypothetical protein